MRKEESNAFLLSCKGIMIKFVHFADSHIGADTVGPTDSETGINGRVLDYLDMVDSIIDFAASEQIDLFLFAGDAFHSRTPKPVYLSEFSKRVKRMLDIAPVVMLVGNHDTGNLELSSSIEIYNSLEVPGIIIGNSFRNQIVETKHGCVSVTMVPYPTNRIMRNELNDNVRKLGDDVEGGMPSILLGHFSVDSAVYGSERSSIIGDDAEISLDSLIDGAWDYIALGHIHMHQCLNYNPPVVYAGSVDRVSFNEENDSKGFVFGKIDDDMAVKWEFIEVDARPYTTISVCIEEDDRQPTKTIIRAIRGMDLQNSVVRLIISVPEYMDKRIHQVDVDRELNSSGMYCISSTTISTRRDNVRTRINQTQFNVGKTPEELLAYYLEEVAEVKTGDMAALLSLAADIMKEVDNG